MEASQDDVLVKIYREHRQQLFTCALAVTRCVHRAEDAIQDAFCRLYRLSVQPEDCKAYVFRAVRNAALDQIRRNPLPADAATEWIFDPRPSPLETAAEKELQQRMAVSLQNLAPDEYETIVQHLYGGLTFREIAEIREAPQGTVTAWYRRGLMKLRSALEAI